VLPAWEAWDVFGEANGTPSLIDLTRRIAKYRRGEPHAPHGHQWIGCLIISTPVFFAPDEWVEQPAGWAPNIVQGKRIDLTSADGRRILETCSANAVAQHLVDLDRFEEDTGSRYGEPQLIRPRLGQGTFRFAVMDAYGACAVTTEHSHPVLEAAHIRPYGEGGKHQVANGLLLRADLHRLFDTGYVTVTPEHRLLVSPRLRDEWHNGRQYYAMHGRQINLPTQTEHHPGVESLQFHNEHVFRG
jgi:putative restriction endonuclease